jgi:UDP-3-O-[3-hydroxymyristoyl] glucosamine N-acyltransferase
MSIALGELAVRFGCELRGDPAATVDHLAPLSSAGPGALSFLANPRLLPQLASVRATAVVLEQRCAADCPVASLITDNPHALFARIAQFMYPPPPLRPGVHPSAQVDQLAQLDPSAEIGALAVIGAGAVIGARSCIGPACVIAEGVRVGADCRLTGRVTLERGVQLGSRVLIHAGAVLGADGFGLAREAGRWLKVPQLGGVRVGDDVEIGANTTIDRGAIEDTVVGEGVKLDNQIQIGHNVHIGAHTAIAGCTGVAGSTHIGARCMIAGGVCFAGHLEICDDVVITGMAMVTNSIRQPGVYSSGIPIEPVRRWRRVVARLKLLAERSSADAVRTPRPRPTPGDQPDDQLQDQLQDQPHGQQQDQDDE